MNLTELVVTVLSISIGPFAILSFCSSETYQKIGFCLLAIPLLVLAFAIFGVFATLTDNNGFGQISAWALVYLSVFSGVIMLGSYAVFALVNRKLQNASTKKEN